MNESVVVSRAGDTEHVVVAQNLSKQFGDEYAVKDVSFSIPRGKIFGFIGPSGSGKTTTVRMLTGIYEPTSGKVTVLGKDPKNFTPGVRADIGYLPQFFVLYPDLSVWENLNFAASLYGLSPFHRKRQLQPLLDFVELGNARNKLARNISGGMQRRLALAATLVHNPDLIILDEPTAGIDPVLRQKFWQRFKELDQQGRTLFITTQYVGEAAYCDLVGVMGIGELLAVDTPQGLRKKAYGGEIVQLETKDPVPYDRLYKLQSLPFIRQRIRATGENQLQITVEDASTAIPELMTWSTQNGITVGSINEFVPPFDDVFVRIVQSGERIG